MLSLSRVAVAFGMYLNKVFTSQGKAVNPVRKTKGSVQADVIGEDTNIIHKSIGIDLGK